MAQLQYEHPESKLFDEDVIDLGQYLQIIRRYIWRILGLTSFLTLLALLIALSLTPIYEARVSLLIEAEQTNVSPVQELYGLDSSRKEYFETQFEILRSRQVAEKVANRLSLHENEHFDLLVAQGISAEQRSISQWFKDLLPILPQTRISEINDELLELKREEYATTLLMESITVVPLKNTQVVEVFVETPNAELSALIANTVAEVYIENYLEAKLEMTEKATEWLNTSLQGLRDKLLVAEQRLAKFFDDNQVVNIDGVFGLASDQVQQLSDQLLEAQITMQRDQALYEEINERNVRSEELASLPVVLNHPSVQSVKREEVVAESNVSELREVYGPKHPIMIAAMAELSSLRSSLNEQITSLISSITSEYRSTQAKVVALQRDLDVAKTELRRLAALDNEHRALQRDVDINQQLYDSFFTRLNETDQMGGFESANARVLDRALIPNIPSKPRKGLIVVAAFILSFGFGAAMALVLEAVNSGIRSVEDVEKKLSQRMLGIIPLESHRRKESLPVKHFFDSKHHMFSESVRTIRTSLQLLNIDKSAKSVLVTSSVPKEGKSTVSVNLAFALGQLNRILLLETDLRKPTIGKLFSLPGFQPGLANVIAGSHTLEECIVHDKESNIDILTAGTLPPNPQELLASEKFGALMEHLHRKYEGIVVDSAPTQAVSDAIIVSNHCDSLVYVVRADKTSTKIINNGLSRFIEVGHRIDGVVLNQVDLKKAQRYGEYSGYYDQYGYNSYSSTNESDVLRDEDLLTENSENVRPFSSKDKEKRA